MQGRPSNKIIKVLGVILRRKKMSFLTTLKPVPAPHFIATFPTILLCFDIPILKIEGKLIKIATVCYWH